MTRLRPRPALDVRVEIRGQLPREDTEYARARALDTAAALAGSVAGDPAVAGAGELGVGELGAGVLRIRLTRVRDRSVTRPVLAQADLALADLGPVRVQLATGTAQESVDLALGTLVGRAVRLSEQGDIGFAAVHESAWRPQFAARPLAERRIARRKAVVLARRTPAEAAREMLALDRRFQLFSDTRTGRDSLVHRSLPDGAPVLLRAGTGVGESDPGPDAHLPIRTEPQAVGRLGLDEAARRLWLTGAPFVFHADPVDGRGRVLYRRYDGHYGLITPVAEGAFGAGIPPAHG
ncbi:sigma 54 modulation/S30EA ribosomal C-terminal domain-containing protein [Kitasatospora sp. NPDC097643]|uniref:sigma 54 modulation/S30EA ribosomal C-terminal domain-containing protein n=1 Tax=Kitasatospora sp. NPDC097643 TaxID=3157230 RepID=UPI00332967DF